MAHNDTKTTNELEMGIIEHLAQAKALFDQTMRSKAATHADAAVDVIVAALVAGKPLLVCGNGGSASDAMHITGELVGRFLKERKALNCICLSSNPAVLTAWSNDYTFDTVFSRQVEAYGGVGGVVLGLSTSGNSRNIIAALERGHAMGMKTVALTGEGGGKMAAHADVLIAVPSCSTPAIQQVHIVFYHYICEMIERRMAQGAA